MSRSRRLRSPLAWLAAAVLVVSACATDDGGEVGTDAGVELGGDLVEDTEAAGDPAEDADDAVDGTDDADAEATDEPAAAEPATDGEAVEEPVLEVVATVAPIADLVAQVGGDRVEVRPLVPPGADSHTYEPRPGDVATLAEADAYVGVGLDLNPGAVRLAEENLPEDAPLLLVGEGLDRDELVFDHVHEHGDDGHSHGDDDGHSHGDDDDGHRHGDDGDADPDRVRPGPNPHVWTSLRHARAIVRQVEDLLVELDPEGADGYRERGEAYREELAALDTTIGDATATIPAANRTLVTYHDAWTYFARDHRFEFATAVQPSDYADPSAAEVRDVIDLIRDLDVPVVFGSEVFPTPVLETIAAETGATYVDDLADDVLPGEPGDPEHSYLGLMRRNAHTIVDALGGDASELTG